MFSIKHPIDCLKTVFKKREGPNRKYILLFITIVTMWIILILGEGGLVPLYMRTKYEWYSSKKSMLRIGFVLHS